MNTTKVIVTQMNSRELGSWSSLSSKEKKSKKRLLRTTSVFAAVCLCLGIGAWSLNNPQQAETVMSHLTTEFKYDDTLGRLQFVSNILPESAMVFLTSNTAGKTLLPTDADISHVWTQEEPWMEFACFGDISACQSGEIMTIVKNRQDEYTVRILHDNGYESIYSGLNTVHMNVHDLVVEGDVIGASSGHAAFELRKDGLSVLPVFSSVN